MEAVAPGLHRLDPAPAGDRALRHGAHLRPRRRQHLPRRALAGAAVPHAPRARLRRLPHADRRASTRRRARPTAAAASPASRASRSSRRSERDRRRARRSPPASADHVTPTAGDATGTADGDGGGQAVAARAAANAVEPAVDLGLAHDERRHPPHARCRRCRRSSAAGDPRRDSARSTAADARRVGRARRAVISSQPDHEPRTAHVGRSPGAASRRSAQPGAQLLAARADRCP